MPSARKSRQPSDLRNASKKGNSGGSNPSLSANKHKDPRGGSLSLSREVFANYVEGNTPDSGRIASPDQRDFNITADYYFSNTVATGLWLRMQRR